METKLSMSVMENLLATYWFSNYVRYWNKNISILIFMSYVIDLFSFSFKIFPLKGWGLTYKQNGYLIY